MLVAEYDGERIEIQSCDNPKTELKKDLLRCPVCKSSLFVRDGMINEAHFCHYADAACDFEKRQGEPETLAHRKLKSYIAGQLCDKNPTAKVALERSVLGGKRIADVYVQYESGNVTVFECQLSRITAGEVLERTADYHRAGLDVYWTFRKGILTEKFLRAIQGLLPSVAEVTVHEI